MKLTVVATALLTASAVNAALDQKIKAKGKKYYGNILDRNTINDGTVQNILNTEFGAITPENAMKWDATERMHSNILQYNQQHC
jgi:endo-1,4-beta-xylanase